MHGGKKTSEHDRSSESSYELIVFRPVWVPSPKDSSTTTPRSGPKTLPPPPNLQNEAGRIDENEEQDEGQGERNQAQPNVASTSTGVHTGGSQPEVDSRPSDQSQPPASRFSTDSEGTDMVGHSQPPLSLNKKFRLAFTKLRRPRNPGQATPAAGSSSGIPQRPPRPPSLTLSSRSLHGQGDSVNTAESSNAAKTNPPALPSLPQSRDTFLNPEKGYRNPLASSGPGTDLLPNPSTQKYNFGSTGVSFPMDTSANTRAAVPPSDNIPEPRSMAVASSLPSRETSEFDQVVDRIRRLSPDHIRALLERFNDGSLEGLLDARDSDDPGHRDGDYDEHPPPSEEEGEHF